MTALLLDDVQLRRRSGFALGPVDVRVPRGGCLGLIGANGAGKSTLMRLVTGYLAPSSGTVTVMGSPVVPGRMPADLAAMIESPRFYDWLDGAGNLRMFSALRRPATTPGEIGEVLERVGLDPGSRRAVGHYSQGMRQRLGLARALLARARVMILDEPTNGLDPVGIVWFRELVAELVGEGTTVVLSSHLLHEVQRTCTSFLMLAEGRPVAQGATTDLDGWNSWEDAYLALVGDT